MKKLLLIAGLVCAMHASAQNTMYVDSVKVLPVNPTAADSVWLHIYWWSGYGTSIDDTTVTHAGNNHSVTACYIVGLTAVVTGGDDSVFLFQGPAGMHVVSWQVFQNGTQATQCDQLVTANQEQINVISTGIDEHGPGNAMNLAHSTLFIQESGLLTIYSTTGQLVHSSNVNAGQRVEINANAGQMYFATLTQDNGQVTTVKFVLQ